ncbi:aspartate kinase [Candidatus Woesearchaeota archaeon]|nr:aspartate kinase [Candidatus Woesearchaeota archaeon]
MLVMKFGGSSLKDPQRIREVSEIIKEHLAECPIIVCSALGKTTDNLLQAGNLALQSNIDPEPLINYHRDIIRGLNIDVPEFEQLCTQYRNLLLGISMIGEESPATMDLLVSFGERLAVRIMAAYLSSQHITARPHDAWDIGFRSTSCFMNGRVLDESYALIKEALKEVTETYAYTPVITGFLAKEKEGKIVTLGRGGSDLTASIIARAIGAKEVQVWKDVDGIRSADPRIVKHTVSIPLIAFEEAAELSFFGAKVLHPRSMLPAMKADIPVRVKNSYNKDHPGSVIKKNATTETLVKVINTKRDITVLDIVSTRMLGHYGFLAKIFEVFGKHEISVDLVATSEVSVSVTLENHPNISDLIMDLLQIAKVTRLENKAIVSIIGDISRSTEILARAAEILKEHQIDIRSTSQGASKVNISFVVEDSDAEKAVQVLHKGFIEVTQ